MRIHSFTTRIALQSAATSGLALLIFGFLCWSLLYKMNMDKIDQMIRSQGQQELSTHPFPKDWRNFKRPGEEREGKGAGRQRPPAMRVESCDGLHLFTSEDWPADVPPNAILEMGGANATDVNDTPPHPRVDERTRPPRDDAPSPRKPRQEDRPLSRDPPRSGQLDEHPSPPSQEPQLDTQDLPTPPPPITFHQIRGIRGANGAYWRVGVLDNGSVTMALGVNWDEAAGEMRRARNAFLLVLPLMLLVVGAGGWLSAQRALRPVTRLTETVESVTSSGLDRRIDDHGYDQEFKRLTKVFNEMMSRLEGSFQQARRFSADAAHELKTPLTILQGHIERALQKAGQDTEAQRTYGELLKEVRHLESIVKKLLMLALADSGRLRLNPEPVLLDEMLSEMIDDTRLIAPRLTIEATLERGIRVNVDADLVRQVLQNLLSNAVKFNTPQGCVNVHLRCSETMARVLVSNSSDLISAEDRRQLFERFFRGANARAAGIDGSGLGLSLAREIARAHGGDLVLEDTAPGLVSITLTLPLSTDHQESSGERSSGDGSSFVSPAGRRSSGA